MAIRSLLITIFDLIVIIGGFSISPKQNRNRSEMLSIAICVFCIHYQLSLTSFSSCDQHLIFSENKHYMALWNAIESPISELVIFKTAETIVLRTCMQHFFWKRIKTQSVTLLWRAQSYPILKDSRWLSVFVGPDSLWRLRKTVSMAIDCLWIIIKMIIIIRKVLSIKERVLSPQVIRIGSSSSISVLKKRFFIHHVPPIRATDKKLQPR